MINDKEIILKAHQRRAKEISMERAREKALIRASRRCVVVKKINRVLDSNVFVDVEEALEVMSIELAQMPEAAATSKIIAKLLKIEKGLENG